MTLREAIDNDMLRMLRRLREATERLDKKMEDAEKNEIEALRNFTGVNILI